MRAVHFSYLILALIVLFVGGALMTGSLPGFRDKQGGGQDGQGEERPDRPSPEALVSPSPEKAIPVTNAESPLPASAEAVSTSDSRTSTPAPIGDLGILPSLTLGDSPGTNSEFPHYQPPPAHARPSLSAEEEQALARGDFVRLPRRFKMFRADGMSQEVFIDRNEVAFPIGEPFHSWQRHGGPPYYMIPKPSANQ